MLLFLSILVGILVGAIHARVTGSGVYEKMDQYLLAYLFPILFVLTGEQFSAQASMQNLRVISIMTLSTGFSLAAAATIARFGLRLQSRDMTNGFIVLAVCANTGHGLMLLSATTTTPDIVVLAGGAFYQGFLVVVILPQLLTIDPNKKTKTFRTIASMICFHPVSYSCIIGFGLAIDPRISIGYGCMLVIRAVIKKWKHKEWKFCDGGPMLVIFLTAAICSQYEFQVKPVGIFITFYTAITIGSKMMNQQMQSGHWRIVFAIMAFGVIIVPFVIMLPLAKAFACNYAEAYVLAYMGSQPPAYLGMVWLRNGKFGELPVGEWAFSLQAVAAYLMALAFPELISFVF